MLRRVSEEGETGGRAGMVGWDQQFLRAEQHTMVERYQQLSRTEPYVRPGHLYVHAPFCARRCSYCDFAVHVSAEPPVAAWADAVGGELALVSAEEGWGGALPLRTLYLGGGTPSLLGVGAVPRLLESLGGHVELSGLVEFTVEANPESFLPALAQDWMDAGVDRISFGAQTFHEPSLRWMGRLHGPTGPDRAVALARDTGFGNIGLDLIFGLPERLERDLHADLDRVLALEPEHVSVYGLSVEETTPLGRWVAEGREAMPEQERYREEYLIVAERLRAEGYVHYEVSNFARPGRESRHNTAYWEGVPYIGLGNGAHSHVPPRRWWNRRDWGEYRTEVAGGRSPRAEAETVDPEGVQLERLWLGLRTARGVPRAALDGARLSLVGDWVRRGWATLDAEQVRLTLEGWLLLDRLTVELDMA
jgi:oxygen-independent coproporphyrinogen III oxidase